MTTGEVRGIMENQKATGPSGFVTTAPDIAMDNISGILTGSINCCVSVSESTADPTAANKDAYKR